MGENIPSLTMGSADILSNVTNFLNKAMTEKWWQKNNSTTDQICYNSAQRRRNKCLTRGWTALTGR